MGNRPTKPALASGSIQGSLVSLAAVGGTLGGLLEYKDILLQVLSQAAVLKTQAALIVASLANIYGIYKRARATHDIKGIVRTPE